MKYTEQPYTAEALVEQFQKQALVVNPEYQRGAVWSERQQGKFLDSIFRSYPIPAVFIRAIEHKGLRGTHSTFELIDGQQRLRALSEFKKDKLRLPPVAGPERLRLPASVAAKPTPWAGKTWTELPPELRAQLDSTLLRVFVIEHPTDDDEVRDLFIRLQAGTALTRQQVRDAWPGPMSPFVESLGGKGHRAARYELLSMIDRRGDRDGEDDGTDPWVSHRQTCAQMLSVFLARERDPYARPRVLPDDLDELYHEATEFDQCGEVANRFKDVLRFSESVFEVAAAAFPGRKSKWKKVQIFSVLLTAQDIQRAKLVPQNEVNVRKLAEALLDVADNQPTLKSRFATGSISQWSDALRERFFSQAGRLDPVRMFPPDLQHVIRERDGGLCRICGKPVETGDAEFDHFPVPWAMCGPTTVDNGRLVHQRCHPRGRPRSGGA